MADNWRYRYGDADPLILTVATAQAVSLGDHVAYEGGTIIRPEDETWASAVATPSAPTVSNTTTTFASGLTNSATGVKVSFNFPWGEGALSAAGSATPTANAGILIAALALPTPAVSRNIYVETSAGSGTYKLWGVDFGGNTVIAGYGIGQVPAASPVLSDATTITQYNFCKTFAGISPQRKLANVATVGTGGGAANQIRIAASGVFDGVCASATMAAGSFVGAAKASGSNLDSQKVVQVTHPLLAFGQTIADITSATSVRYALRARRIGVRSN